ncbi:MAG: Lrp/AsnC family transcriptional regulator [Desulfamplus sp.]|nr:Lrp/AsnC family transcriptional regulator [Desulfamplus sp.]
MDETDFKILKILQAKARIPNVEVARKIGMAPSAVLERIKKLEARGIISGYEMRVNPAHFNRSMIAFIKIQTRPAMAGKAARHLSRFETFQEIHYIAGDDCLLAKVRIRDGAELEKILTDTIGSMAEVECTRSALVISTYKESAAFPLPDSLPQE